MTLGSFIVPEEFATLLGLVFSTIPQVKKGTDSRIGFGYRFGNHADTQVLLELGPQKNTQKLGSDGSSDSSSFTSKREVDPEDFKKIADSKDWIQKWSQHMAEEQKSPIVVTTDRPEEGPTVKVKPFIPESSLQQLVQLYKTPQDPMKGSSSMDSVIQFQDRHRVFLKRPSAEKLNNFAQQQKHEKKKLSDDLMNVNLE